MLGADFMQDTLFSTRSLESFVPGDHPLRPIRELLNTALAQMDRVFDAMYAKSGRDSIAPEKLLRAMLLQAFHSIRSRRTAIG